MTDEEKLYGMMAIVEEQQKNLDTTLKNIQATAIAIAKERTELTKTVGNISTTVGESASDALLNALGEAQKRFSDEMSRTTGNALKTAQDANKELEKAKNTITSFTSDLRGTLKAEISKLIFIYGLLFSVIMTLSFGGIYWYFLTKADEAQSSAVYWNAKSEQAYERCQKLKNCRTD